MLHRPDDRDRLEPQKRGTVRLDAAFHFWTSAHCCVSAGIPSLMIWNAGITLRAGATEFERNGSIFRRQVPSSENRFP